MSPTAPQQKHRAEYKSGALAALLLATGRTASAQGVPIAEQNATAASTATTTATTQAAPIPYKTDIASDSPASSPMTGIFLLILVTAALACYAWVRNMRRRGSGASGNRTPWVAPWRRRNDPALQIMASTRLQPGASLHEVHWQGRRLLIGCSEQQITLLCDQQLAPCSSVSTPASAAAPGANTP